MVDGLRHGDGDGLADVDATIPRLAPRWFVVRDAHDPAGPCLLNPRYALSLLRGPMTKAELERAREDAKRAE